MSKKSVIFTVLLPIIHSCDQHHFTETVPAAFQRWDCNTSRLEAIQYPCFQSSTNTHYVNVAINLTARTNPLSDSTAITMKSPFYFSISNLVKELRKMHTRYLFYLFSKSAPADALSINFLTFQ